MKDELDRISNIGFEITALSEESERLRADIFAACAERFGTDQGLGEHDNPYQFLDGQRVWTVCKPEDAKCKDLTVTYRDYPAL